jgi:protein O-mannosyl-transferase
MFSVPASIDKKIFKNCVLFFLGLSFLIYGKSIGNKYSMDDEYVTYNNVQIHKGIAAIPEIFRTTYSIDSKSSFEYRPLVKVTYAIEYQLFGENPSVSHFINILFYVLCLVILFYVLLRLIPQYNYLFALTVTLLFLIHPLHSEVVLSLKNRDVMLSFIGCMMSLLFYLRFVEGKGNLNVIYGFLWLLFALMSKKDCMPFMAVIPFTVWFFRNANWKQLSLIIVSFLPVLLSYRTAAKAVVNDTVRTLSLWENPLFVNHFNFFDRIPQGFYSLYFYFKIFLIPHPLISYYGYDQMPIVGWEHPVVWIMMMLLVFLTYFIIKKKLLKELWVYGLIYFLITISMFTNVVKPVVGIVGERFAFIPSLGLCIVVAVILFKYFKVQMNTSMLKLKTVSNNFWIALTLIIMIHGAKVFSRNAAWKNVYTLYKTDVINAPESAHTHSLLAAAAVSKLKTAKRLSLKEKNELIHEAEHEYLESIRIIPDYISSHNNLGTVYYSYLKNPEKAVVYLERAVKLDPGYVEAYFNLGSAYATLKQYDKAEQAYLKTIEINPAFVNSYLSLSNLYSFEKKYDKIIALNTKAIEKGIKSDVMYINIGNVYYMRGDTISALPFLEKAISYNPNNKGVNTFLSNYYSQKGDSKKAAHYSELLSRSFQ